MSDEKITDISSNSWYFEVRKFNDIRARTRQNVESYSVIRLRIKITQSCIDGNVTEMVHYRIHVSSRLLLFIVYIFTFASFVF